MAENKRKVWSRAETLGFLKCYSARKEEFKHSRKKKSAYAHVLEDMIAQRLTDASTNVHSLESRMRTLMGAYKTAKDNAGETGASPCPAPYYNELDEIFGDSPIVSNNHTVQMGFIPVQSNQTSNENEQEKENAEPEPSQNPEPGPSNPKKKKTYKEQYYETKLQIKREEADKKVKQRQEFLNDIKNFFEKKTEEKLEIEKTKLKCLQVFLEKQ